MKEKIKNCYYKLHNLVKDFKFFRSSPFIFLLIFVIMLFTITNCSKAENLSDYLPEDAQEWLANEGTPLTDAILFGYDSLTDFFAGNYGGVIGDVVGYCAQSEDYMESLRGGSGGSGGSGGGTSDYFADVHVYEQSFNVGRYKMTSGSWESIDSPFIGSIYYDSQGDIGHSYKKAVSWQNRNGYGYNYSYYDYKVTTQSISIDIYSLLKNTRGDGYGMYYSGTDASFMIGFNVVNDVSVSSPYISQCAVNSQYLEVRDTYHFVSGDSVVITLNYPSSSDFPYECTDDYINVHEVTMVLGVSGTVDVSRPKAPKLYPPNINNYGDMSNSQNYQRYYNDMRVYDAASDLIKYYENAMDMEEKMTDSDDIIDIIDDNPIFKVPSDFLYSIAHVLSTNYSKVFYFDINEIKWNNILIFPETHFVFDPDDLFGEYWLIIQYLSVFFLTFPWILFLINNLSGGGGSDE